MDVNHLFNLKPFFNLFLSNHCLAFVAQVNYFSFLWITLKAEIIEKDVDYKLMRQIFSIVFSNVLGAQFHFSCFDVVSTLNEGSIEHYSEHRLVGKACMLKDYLYITTQDTSVLLLLGQQENHSTFFR